MIRKFLKDESGAAAVEYGLLAVMFVLGIIGSWRYMGNSLGDFMNRTAHYFANQVN